MMKNDDPTISIKMRHHFDGDIDGLIRSIRMGKVFSVNGRPLPIDGIRRSGSVILVPFPHRTLEIDLSSAVERASKSGSIDIQIEIER